MYVLFEVLCCQLVGIHTIAVTVFLSLVVTGSTHGIGRAFAQELASFGINIAVVSLNDMDCSQTTSNLGSTKH